MKEKHIVSAVTLLTSLAGYFYAKHTQRDAVPIVMVSGFFGAMLGESLYRILWDKSGNDQDKNPPPAF